MSPSRQFLSNLIVWNYVIAALKKFDVDQLSFAAPSCCVVLVPRIVYM
jgi:hypothetical protein